MGRARGRKEAPRCPRQAVLESDSFGTWVCLVKWAHVQPQTRMLGKYCGWRGQARSCHMSFISGLTQHMPLMMGPCHGACLRGPK